MKIRTIRVEGFKRFRDAFTLEDLVDGINLIAAPNGSGTSTIAEAVRVGFQERHRTAILGETLAPWTQPGASPSVQIEFMYDGKRHRVSKTFGGKKSCSLDVDGKSTTGDDAEQILSNMFSFSYASKGVSRAEHQGVPGLLWVRQGSAGEIAPQVAGAHEYISRALGNDMGELAAT
ncbi:MAG: GTP-binding protein, partial [Ramlibacter sp.]|nr:GTP-binding protein [Ramlibacter sp.]